MVTTSKISTKNMVLIGMFAAVLAVVSQLAIPMPSGVPMTMQMFAVALCGVVLGWKFGAASMVIYILIGAFGVPVFANFRGGLAVIFGKTGGFIFGYPFMAMLCGLSVYVKPFWQKVLCCVAGVMLSHLFGTLQFMWLTGLSFPAAALIMSLPYLVKDILLVIAATAIGNTLRASISKTVF